MRVLVLLVVAACGRVGFAHHGDGATGDGTVGDVAPPTGDTAPPAACQPQWDICDSFETGVNAAVWVTDPMVMLDTTRGHRGTSSIHVHTAAFAAGNDSYEQLEDNNTLATRTTFWIRGWFWLSALPASTNGMELITAHRPAGPGNYVFVRSTRTSVYSQFEDRSVNSTTLVPTGEWFCLVFKVIRSPSAVVGQLELTGAVPNVMLMGATDDTQMIQKITLGMSFAGNNVVASQPAFDLWIDDVIIDDAAVSCTD